jgi:hypothetical protein
MNKQKRKIQNIGTMKEFCCIKERIAIAKNK